MGDKGLMSVSFVHFVWVTVEAASCGLTGVLWDRLEDRIPHSPLDDNTNFADFKGDFCCILRRLDK